ncbi:MAG: YciI-like protein [Bacteroidota bacterium]
MKYFILFYETVEAFVEKRAPFRATHLQHAQKAVEAGHLLLGGALEEPADKAVLLFRGRDKQVAIDFAKNDPYVEQGLITKWEVRPWKVMLGTKMEN